MQSPDDSRLRRALLELGRAARNHEINEQVEAFLDQLGDERVSPDHATGRQAAQTVSVGDILIQSGESDDPWHLAIVQRDRVWDAFKAAKLFDSLLAGFPIGSLLLCRTEEPSAAIERGGQRAVLESSTWQVLDGQQRLWALSVLFGGDHDTSAPEFFFCPAAPREELKPGVRDEHLHRWVTWQDSRRDPFGSGGKTRSEWVSIRALGRALSTPEDRPREEDGGDEALLAWLRTADPEYAPQNRLDADAARRITSLLAAWTTPFIPVQRIDVAGPDDVLEVFERVNMEGVRTSAADIFFAAVKTRWPEAELGLDGFRGQRGPLTRLDALRIVARGAARGLGGGDPIPVNVKRLNGRDGRDLVAAMNRLACDPAARARVARTLEALERPLGYALHLVDRFLLDAVLLWAIWHDPEPPAESELAKAAAYLFWGSALKLQPVLRETYARAALTRIEPGKPFPLHGLLEAAREVSPSLAYQRVAVPRPFEGNPADQRKARRDCASGRGALFLSIAQQIPFKPASPLDWDHIFPKALRLQLKWKGESGKDWSHFHHKAGAIWRVGNLAGLDAAVNRSLQDVPPREKLRRLEEKRDQITVDLFLSDLDRRRLREVEKLLPAHDGKAPEVLARFVAEREDAIWQAAVARFPLISEITPALFGERVRFEP